METFTRRLTVAAVLGVAGAAAVVSFNHLFDLARTHGQSALSAGLIPLSIDGDVLASGLVLLWFARRQAPSPVLGRVMLFSGVGMTVWANLVYGLPFGFFGSVLSAWPGYAFVGCAELILSMVRHARMADMEYTPPLPGLHELFKAEIDRKELPSIRTIRSRLKCGQAKATETQRYIGVLIAD